MNVFQREAASHLRSVGGIAVGLQFGHPCYWQTDSNQQNITVILGVVYTSLQPQFIHLVSEEPGIALSVPSTPRGVDNPLRARTAPYVCQNGAYAEKLFCKLLSRSQYLYKVSPAERVHKTHKSHTQTVLIGKILSCCKCVFIRCFQSHLSLLYLVIMATAVNTI